MCTVSRFCDVTMPFCRPVVASLATLPTEKEDTKFYGHVDIRKYNITDRMNADEVGHMVGIGLIFSKARVIEYLLVDLS